ncbi:hypothetical protein Tco_0809202 [Tanacetum coccineum]
MSTVQRLIRRIILTMQETMLRSIVLTLHRFFIPNSPLPLSILFILMRIHVLAPTKVERIMMGEAFVSSRMRSSSSGGSARQAFPQRNLSGDGIAVGVLYQSHRSCQDVSDMLTESQNQLVEAIRSRSKLSDDHKTLQQEHIGHAEIVRHNYIWQLIPTVFQWLHSSDEYNKSLSNVFNQAIAIRWSEGVKVECSAEDAEAILAAATDYDPECRSTFMLVFDALFTKRYPYVEKIAESFRLPLGDLQNMWPEGEGPTIVGSNGFVFLFTFLYYSIVIYILLILFCSWSPCSGRFCSSLGHWRLDSSRTSLRFGKCSSLGHWRLDSSRMSCVSKNVRHLAIGAWTHPGRLSFKEMFVTWPLALGLIWDVLRPRKCSSLGHWRLDSSGTSCILGDDRHLAIGAWTHLGRLAFWEMIDTWPLALGLIWDVLHSERCSSLGHWCLDSSGTSYVPGNVRLLAIGAWTHPG